jgi:hypothetical protein
LKSVEGKIFKLLKKYNEIKQGVEINWYYPEHDYDSRKIGEIFQKMLCDVVINIIVKYD